MASIITRLTTTGNSKALRLTKELLEMSQLGNVVEVEAKRGQIIIRNGKNPRAGWEKAIMQDILAHGPLATHDEFGDLATERDDTLSDGLTKW